MTSPASLDAAVARLRLVAETRAAGATWAQIGAGMKMSGPEAKREVHRLERDTRRAFLAEAQAEQGIAPAYAPKRPAPVKGERFRPHTLTVLTDHELAGVVAELIPDMA